MSSVPLTSEQQMNTFRLRDKMSLLNAEFLKVLNGFYTEKNHYDFTGTMLSYMEHVKNLKTMYKVDDEVAAQAAPKPAPPVTNNSANPNSQRKIAKAVRRNGAGAVDTPKIANSTIFAASSPAATATAPKFGDISVISKETPAPLPKAPAAEPPAPAAPAAARKRAIRGGGPLGGSESVVFKSGEPEKVTTSSAKIPETTIKFPEPSKDFWTKKSDAPNNGGSLFAFLKNDNDADKTKEPTKFTGFSFGKKAEGPAEGEKKSEEPKIPLFGTTKPSESNLVKTTPSGSDGSPKPSIFGGIGKTTSPEAPKLAIFGEKKSEDAPKPFQPLSFGASLFGSASSNSTAPKLSFGTSTASATAPGGSSLFSGFAGLAQKAMENQAKPEGGDDEEAEYVPPKVETVESEEPDSVLSSKVSVFKFNGKEYSKLGIGMLHVKDTDGKFSVLIRAATTTGTVWLNSLCNKAMKATKVDEKGDRIRLTCPTSTTEMSTMMIRFGTADGAKKFTDKIEEFAK